MTGLDKWVLNRFKKRENNLKDFWLPLDVEYTDEGMRGFGGFCNYNIFGNKIKIRTKYKNQDKGILNHELTHARQYCRLFWIHSTLTIISKKYVLWIELEAYRTQIKSYNYTNKSQYQWIVNLLSDKKRYGLNISKKETEEYADYMFADLIR